MDGETQSSLLAENLLVDIRTTKKNQDMMFLVVRNSFSPSDL